MCCLVSLCIYILYLHYTNTVPTVNRLKMLATGLFFLFEAALKNCL